MKKTLCTALVCAFTATAPTADEHIQSGIPPNYAANNQRFLSYDRFPEVRGTVAGYTADGRFILALETDGAVEFMFFRHWALSADPIDILALTYSRELECRVVYEEVQFTALHCDIRQTLRDDICAEIGEITCERGRLRLLSALTRMQAGHLECSETDLANLPNSFPKNDQIGNSYDDLCGLGRSSDRN